MKFHYRALNAEGKPQEGVLEVDDQVSAIQSLREQGMVPLLIEQEKSAAPTSASKMAATEWFGVSSQTVCNFTRSFSELLDTGIPVVASLDALSQYTPSPGLRQAMSDISADIQRGQGMAQAFSKFPAIFNATYVNLLRVGEVTGNLPQVTSQLADYLERDQETRNKIRMAMTYPIFILVFSSVLLWLMVAFLLPGFAPMWQEAGLDLHKYPVTLVLMQMSAITHNIWDELGLLVLVGLLLTALRRLMSSQQSRHWMDGVLLKLPVLGGMVSLATMARLTSTLGIMLNSGVSLIEALENAGKASGNQAAEAAVEQVKRDVLEGKPLSTGLSRTSFFPPMFVQMVSIGEKSGQIGKMLPRVARHYEVQLDTAVKSFSTLIEPLMMVFVGGIVFTFIIGVFLPIMGVVQALQNQM